MAYQPETALESFELRHPLDDWTPVAESLDLRDLEPPAPMLEILAALGRLAPGQILEARLSRRPVFLLPRLEDQGHPYLLEPDRDEWRLRIKKV